MIYLDHAAATPLDPRVLSKMTPFLNEQYANPSSPHSLGRKARAAIDNARADIAKILQCKAEEIIFTSGGTEANNLAIVGLAEAHKNKGNHIVTTAIEHHSILEPCRQLELRGFKVTYIKPDPRGLISIENLERALRPETILVSIIYANNEIGVVQDIAAMGKLLQKKGIIFHTDACQAAGLLPISIKDLCVDTLTLNAGKIYGPKGSGLLYKKENLKIVPLLFGGGQEHRMRSGTENVAGIVGLAEALKIAENEKEHEVARLTKLRDWLIQELTKLPGAALNGDPIHRLANNINISFEGHDAETLLIKLDNEGIAASSTSACTSGMFEPSHVLRALGLSEERVKSALRFSLGRENTQQEIEKAVDALKKIIGKYSS